MVSAQRGLVPEPAHGCALALVGLLSPHRRRWLVRPPTPTPHPALNLLLSPELWDAPVHSVLHLFTHRQP